MRIIPDNTFLLIVVASDAKKVNFLEQVVYFVTSLPTSRKTWWGQNLLAVSTTTKSRVAARAR